MGFHLCSELFSIGSRLTVFIVPNFDRKSHEKLEPTEGKNTITVQKLDDENTSFTFKINIETASVKELKQIVYHFTNLPTYEIRLKIADSYLVRETNLLSDYDIVNDQKIFYERVEFYNNNFI